MILDCWLKIKEILAKHKVDIEQAGASRLGGRLDHGAPCQRRSRGRPSPRSCSPPASRRAWATSSRCCPSASGPLIGHVVAVLREAGRAAYPCRHRLPGGAAGARTGAPRRQRRAQRRFRRGMFSSVQAGVASLPAGIEAFPARAGRRAADARLDGRAGAATPRRRARPSSTRRFRGERGHPPLIRRALFGEILGATGTADCGPCSPGTSAKRPALRCSTGDA